MSPAYIPASPRWVAQQQARACCSILRPGSVAEWPGQIPQKQDTIMPRPSSKYFVQRHLSGGGRTDGAGSFEGSR